MRTSTNPLIFLLAAAGTISVASVAAAQSDKTPKASAAIDTQNVVDVLPAKLPYGFLSDPVIEPVDILESLLTGKVYFNNRLRLENADTTGRDSSTAITNRLRLGYASKPFHGFRGFVEMENIASPDEGNYFVPATSGGTSTRTVIADPAGTEMNQAYAHYNSDSVTGSDVSLDIKVGRQRIKIDDDRFIGNVGWRQREQTFDAVNVKSDLGVEGLTAQYVFVWQVRRIFGDEGPNWDSQSHLFNASYKVIPELKVTPFLYLLDFEDDSPANSVNNVGVRFTGDIGRDSEDANRPFFDYELTYAQQSDAGDNTTDYDAEFLAVQGRLILKGTGSATVGYQLLGSDDGMAAFRFPLGTNHKFQGFADTFLGTPANGLQDLYVGGALDLPYGIKSSATIHQFWSDEGSTDLGYEIDLVASKKIYPNWAVLLKVAHFDGDNGMQDTTRVWAQTELQF
jgi:hypothetical protein